MNPKTIWSEKQNKVSLIADDLEWYAARGDVYEVLLKRGVFKAFAMWRQLVTLSAALRHQSSAVQKCIVDGKALGRADIMHYNRGYLQAVEDMRLAVAKILDGERWTVQDNDSRAWAWLVQRTGQERADTCPQAMVAIKDALGRR